MHIPKGTGMGLTTVDRIVHRNEGHIVLESKPGQGTTFRLLFSEDIAAKPEENIRAADTQHLSPEHNHHILVVDDDRLIGCYLEDLLEAKGYKITVFSECRDVLESVTQSPNQFDLAILDQTMPEMTGGELYQKIVEVQGNIPVILCSGHGDAIDKVMMAEMGITEFIPKPIETHILLEKIENMLLYREY